MKTQLDEKQDLLRKVERLSSADEVQKVKAFIVGMEVGKAVQKGVQKRPFHHEVGIPHYSNDMLLNRDDTQ